MVRARLVCESVFEADHPAGFAVLGDYEDPTIQQAQKQAFDVTLGWLKAH